MALPARAKNVVKRKRDKCCFRVSKAVHMQSIARLKQVKASPEARSIKAPKARRKITRTKTMSNMTLGLMGDALKLGVPEDGLGPCGAIGIADAGRGRSTAMTMMATTTSGHVERCLRVSDNGGDILKGERV